MTENEIGYERTLNEGEVLFREGDEGNEMYLIKTGKIRIVKQMDEEEKTLAILDEGSFFGEMAVLDQRPRSASAIADTDAVLIIVDRDAFLNKVNENPFIKYTLNTLTERLRKTNDKLKYYSVPNEQIRFLHYLKDKAGVRNKEFGENIDSGLSSKGNEISDMIGIDKNKVKQYLKRLEKYNIIELNETIIIKSLAKLQKYEEFIALQEEFNR